MPWRFLISLLAWASLLALAACDSSTSRPRTSDETAMFSPVSMRLYPAFTLVKDLSGNNGTPNGIEALVEFDDRFGDPTRAAGTLTFELFEYRSGWPDPRGNRLSLPWPGKILTVDQQNAHWDRALRAYSFQLVYAAVRTDRDYVLDVEYDPGNGPRLFAQTIISATQPRYRPVTRPTSHESSTRADIGAR
jgi:hypothetical protein